MRTFLALDLPPHISDSLADLAETFRGFAPRQANWVSRPNFHITLQFIGDTPPHLIPEIISITEVRFASLQGCRFSGATVQLIPPRNPRLCWIALHCMHPELQKKVIAFRRDLQQMDIEVDIRPVKFHITLGRIKKRLPDFLIQKILTTELKIDTFTAPGITLYQSLLRPEGPVYNPLAQYTL
ncbi:MAG: RNA 2',3'-cyclic phosphodiesterase [Candidatus Cloacimonetes bacterium]|nr:RNA 2',3'-cyclic phosphodiesterase [Candidatus Cloacimonadota bacterium]